MPPADRSRMQRRQLALECDANAARRGRAARVRQLAAVEATEKGLLSLRKALDVYANLRPVYCYESLIESSPLKNDIVRGTTS